MSVDPKLRPTKAQLRALRRLLRHGHIEWDRSGKGVQWPGGYRVAASVMARLERMGWIRPITPRNCWGQRDWKITDLGCDVVYREDEAKGDSR